MNWSDNCHLIKDCLDSLTVTDDFCEDMEIERAFELWTELALQVKSYEGYIFLIGNGASASMASHVATDLSKNANIKSIVFTDLSLITATANDISFEDVFAEPLRNFSKSGDMVVAISSSGRSKNILKAVKTAKEGGVYVVTLSAMTHENPLRNMGGMNFYVPAQTYGMAETCHAAILHHWIDRILNKIKS